MKPSATPSSVKPLALMPLGAALLLGGLVHEANAQAAPAPQQPSPPTVDATLAPVRVTDQADAPDGFRATSTRVGRTLQDPHDIPQGVTTVTRSLMDSQQVGSLREAMRNVSGLSFNAAEGGRSGDNMSLRGFYTFGDVYLDGIRDTAQYNRETFHLEQIDVLRGAGAMLFGRGQAGGVINQVSKVPLSVERHQLSLSVGTDDYRQVTADLNKPINADTAVRLNLMKRTEGSWRENPVTGATPEVDREGVALSLALNQSGADRFWINHLTLKTRDLPDYGVSFDPATRRPGQIQPVETFFGIDRNFDHSDTSLTTLVHEHHFSPTAQLRTQYRYATYGRTYWAKTPNLSTPPNAVGSVGGNQTRDSDYRTHTLQSDFNTRMVLAGMPHQVLAGLEYLKEDSSRKGLQNFGTNAAPDFRPGQRALTGNTAEFTGDSYGLFLQDTVEFIPQWKLTAGVRRDELDAEYASATSPKLSFGENSWRGALSWHPSDEVHYYFSYSDSFSPTADLYQLTVKPQPAERSEVFEVGAKLLLLDGDLSLRTALFRATKNWERSTDLESTASILTRRRRTDGLEIEAAGRITPQWEVFAGWALLDAEILKVATNFNPNTGVATTGNLGYEGQRARNTPRYTVNLWSTYALPGGWKLGGGAEAKGRRQGFNPSSAAALPTLNGAYHPNTAPSYVRWDAMVAYEKASWAVRLNVKNLFDKVYYDAIYDNGPFTVPGLKRQVILTGEYTF